MPDLVDDLLKLVAPPDVPVSGGSLERFAAVESEIGLQLPSDYKKLVAAYGDGCWQGFWYLLNPFSGNQHLNLLVQASREGASGYDILSAERAIKKLETEYPHRIWPEQGGIFPWGITDNGGRFFWLTAGSTDHWPTIYFPSRDPDFETYKMSVSEIVFGAVSGVLTIFADEFEGEIVLEGIPLFAPLAA